MPHLLLLCRENCVLYHPGFEYLGLDYHVSKNLGSVLFNARSRLLVEEPRDRIIGEAGRRVVLSKMPAITIPGPLVVQTFPPRVRVRQPTRTEVDHMTLFVADDAPCVIIEARIVDYPQIQRPANVVRDRYTLLAVPCEP